MCESGISKLKEITTVVPVLTHRITPTALTITALTNTVLPIPKVYVNVSEKNKMAASTSGEVFESVPRGTKSEIVSTR